MKLLLSLLLLLGLTGCIEIPLPEFGNNDKDTTQEKLQENRSEAQMAQKEYQDLQNIRTAE